MRLRFSPGIGRNCLNSVSGPMHGKKTNEKLEKNDKTSFLRRRYGNTLCLRNDTAQGSSKHYSECEHVPVGIPPDFGTNARAFYT